MSIETTEASTLDAITPDPCFPGDTSDMPWTARRLAIVLKTGGVIRATSDHPDEIENLLAYQDEIVESLNADCLELRYHTDLGVAWASPAGDLPDDTPCLLKKARLSEHDVALFAVITLMRTERRRAGYKDDNALQVRTDEVQRQWNEAVYAGGPPGDAAKRDRDLIRALERARCREWIEYSAKKDRLPETLRATPVLDALEEEGTLLRALESLEAMLSSAEDGIAIESGKDENDG